MSEAATETRDEATAIAESYYDSSDADIFYATIWGGEDIHIGLYDGPGDSIRDASRRTVEHMAERLRNLKSDARVLDIGSGYGGAARYLAAVHGAHVTCLNLSRVENERNRQMSVAQGVGALVDVVHGAFEDIPEPDGAFDIVWSQDAILHSGDRASVMAEVARVLKPGGEFVFTDPMQSDSLRDESVLQPIYDRIHLSSLGSIGFYRRTLGALGMEEVKVELATPQLRTHYARVREELAARRGELEGEVSSGYIDRMLLGLQNWVDGADQGHLAWAIMHFRKPS